MSIPVWAGSAINGDPLACANAWDRVVQIDGTFTATVVLQGTINGTGWFDLETFTAPGFCHVDALCPAVQSLRIRKTAQTSDTSLTAHLGFRVAA
jgi:hypothetical protein